jgi:5-methylcytosine-specific restriction protein A
MTRPPRIPTEAGFCNIRDLPKGPRGFALCRQCSNECPASRRTFCSPECVHAWKCRTDPSYQAREVYKRDAGVCGKCGLDCSKGVMAWMQGLERITREWTFYRRGRHMTPTRVAMARAKKLLGWWLARYGLPSLESRRRLWDMDHIVPVAEGGGSCGLDNLRTLCVPCHRGETRALAGRRAAARRIRGSCNEEPSR